MESLIYVAVFFLLIWGMFEIIKWTGKRNTRLAEQKLQYDIMYKNLQRMVNKRHVNETSYNELSGYFSTLAKLPHKNREKSEVLWMSFMKKYKDVIDEINLRREMEEREIKSRNEFDPSEVFMEIDDCRPFNIVPAPISLQFSKDNKIIGEFKETDGVFTFTGKMDESAEWFVDYVCESFKQRIEYLSNKDDCRVSGS